MFSPFTTYCSRLSLYISYPEIFTSIQVAAIENSMSKDIKISAVLNQPTYDWPYDPAPPLLSIYPQNRKLAEWPRRSNPSVCQWVSGGKQAPQSISLPLKGLISFSPFLNLKCLHVFIYCVCVDAFMPWLTCEGPRTTCRSWISSSTMWVLGIQHIVNFGGKH